MPTPDPVQAPGHTPHPTRSAPKCADCRYLADGLRGERPVCDHPTMPVDVVTGKPVFLAEYARSEDAEPYARHGLTICGAAGLLFAPAGRMRCPECRGAGKVRIPYSEDFEDCSLCLASSDISPSTVKTAASENAPGSNA